MLDWLAVVGTAAAVATAVSTSAVLWFRRSDRPEPDWAPAGRAWMMRETSHNAETAVFDGQLTNAGDGAAFRVTLTGIGCDAILKGEQPPPRGDRIPFITRAPELAFVPLIMPGDEITLAITCAPGAWNTARIVIEWTASPTRKKNRIAHELALTEIAPRPTPSDD